MAEIDSRTLRLSTYTDDVEDIKDKIKDIADNKNITIVENTDTPLSVLTKINNGTVEGSPTTDGIYQLTAVVVSGTITYGNWTSIGIAFSVGLVNYVAESGMTWSQWILSDYSNSEFQEDNGAIKDSLGGVVYYNGNPVVPSDTITNNTAYEIIY